MSSAIDLYRKLGCYAVEVDNERTDNMLTPEFVSGEPPITKVFPEDGLCFSRILAQGASVAFQDWILHGSFICVEILLVDDYLKGIYCFCQAHF